MKIKQNHVTNSMNYWTRPDNKMYTVARSWIIYEVLSESVQCVKYILLHCNQCNNMVYIEETGRLYKVPSHYTTLHYTTLHYTTLHYTTLHYTTLHYTTQHYTTLHCTALHYTAWYNVLRIEKSEKSEKLLIRKTSNCLNQSYQRQFFLYKRLNSTTTFVHCMSSVLLVSL